MADKNATIDNNLNPFCKEAQAWLVLKKKGPAIIYQDELLSIEEYIYNWEMTISQMRDHKNRLWMMQSLADFLDNQVCHEKFGSKPRIESLITDFNILQKIHQRVATYKLTDAEKSSLGDCLSLIQKPEEEFVLSLLENYPADQLYLVHGDCHSLNCLYDKTAQKLIFIDYEFATLNPFLTDIAYICNECLFDYQVPKFPYYRYEKSAAIPEAQVQEMIKTLLVFWDHPHLRLRKFDTAEKFDSEIRTWPEFNSPKWSEGLVEVLPSQALSLCNFCEFDLFLSFH